MIEAIKMAAVDYLLKPISPTDLEDLSPHLKKRKQKAEHIEAKWVHENRMAKIAVPTSNGIKFLETQNILFL